LRQGQARKNARQPPLNEVDVARMKNATMMIFRRSWRSMKNQTKAELCKTECRV